MKEIRKLTIKQRFLLFKHGLKYVGTDKFFVVYNKKSGEPVNWNMPRVDIGPNIEDYMQAAIREDSKNGNI